jgi:hypothetical protein
MNHPRTGGFQDQACLGLFVSPLGAFRASGTCGSRDGEPRAAIVFPWPTPDPGIFSVPLSLRRPKRLLGFHLAANSFTVDQWTHLRHLGDAAAQEVKDNQDDDRRPKWDTASPTTKKEWKSTISTMKREASALTEPVASAPFRASLFPTCLLHAEADLKPKKDFKEALLRTNVAGACGLALIRCGEMASPP